MFKITYGQIRAILIISAALFSTWIIMGHCARFKVIEGVPEGRVVVNVSFLAPMNPADTENRLSVTGDVPGRKVLYRTQWISRNTVRITIDEPDYPRGLQYRLNFDKYPALIPPFTVSAQKKVKLPLVPKVISLEPQANVPTGGPLVLAFNTPLDPESFRKHVSTTAPGKFAPRAAGPDSAHPWYDYSRWVLMPDQRFNNNTTYKIRVAGGLRGAGGGIAGENTELTFSTAPALEITEIYPRPNSPSIWLSRNISVKTNQDLREAEVRVAGMAGKVTVSGNSAVFHPDELFLPSKRYTVSINLTSVYGEQIKKEFSFGTTNLGNQRWLSIKLGNPCSVQVFEGNRQLKAFYGWMSIPREKVPTVTMYELKRGSTLEFNPGHTPPVRYILLNADIMIHHVSPGESHSHSPAGLPPSYGCLLLNKTDVDWIFDNVPAKCMVIIH